MDDRQRLQPRAPARALAVAALLLAVVVIAYILLSSGSSYTVRLLFSDASGLVTGDQVMIGPSSVGSVEGFAGGHRSRPPSGAACPPFAEPDFVPMTSLTAALAIAADAPLATPATSTYSARWSARR